MDPDRWLVITVRVPAEGQENDLVEALLALGGAAVEQDRDHLSTYVHPPEDPDAFVRAAFELLRAAAAGRELDIDWRWQQNEDWARTWRRGLAPRRVGERMIVAPSWTTPETRPGDVVVVVDPQMAFGTGEHATTRITLRLLESAVRAGDRVLDVGAGSGILAIAAALLGGREVVAAESDPEAEENARANIRRNGVAERVAYRSEAVDAAFLAAAGRFDVIVANVLSGVLRPLLPAFLRSLRPEGRLILCGLLEEEAPSMRSAAKEAGFAVASEDAEEGWWGVLLVPGGLTRRREAARR